MSIIHIGIAGCGIGGLAVAKFLAEQGHQITIYDQFAAPVPVGSGLVIQPVGQAVLQALGIREAVLSKGAIITNMIGHESNPDRCILNVRYSHTNPHRFGLGIHRASLFTTLYQRAQSAGVEIVPQSQVSGTQLSGNGRVIEFKNNNTSKPYDLIIDALGAGSVLSPLKRKALKFGAIWGTVDWPATSKLPLDALSQKYKKASIMMGVLPIGKNSASEKAKAAIFWSMPQTDYSRWLANPLDEWKEQACALWPAFEPFLDEIQSHHQMTLARYHHGTLPRPYDERLAFIGDAAHCASPQLGQGANMALLDAFALAESLREHKLDEALIAYAKARRAHVKIYQFLSKTLTPMYQSDSNILPLLRNYLLTPAAYLPPFQWVLGKLVSGDLVKPVRGCNLPEI